MIHSPIPDWSLEVVAPEAFDDAVRRLSQGCLSVTRYLGLGTALTNPFTHRPLALPVVAVDLAAAPAAAALIVTWRREIGGGAGVYGGRWSGCQSGKRAALAVDVCSVSPAGKQTLRLLFTLPDLGRALLEAVIHGGWLAVMLESADGVHGSGMAMRLDPLALMALLSQVVDALHGVDAFRDAAPGAAAEERTALDGGDDADHRYN